MGHVAIGFVLLLLCGCGSASAFSEGLRATGVFLALGGLSLAFLSLHYAGAL